MNEITDDVASLIEIIRRKDPEYLDLLTARTDEEFYFSLDRLLEKAVIDLESNGKNFKEVDEEGLTAALTMRITIPGLDATQETNSNGHVDITITARDSYPARIVLGEAKIYKGPVYHLKGLDQLINRYSTGRAHRGLLIEYYRERNITGLVAKLRKKMDDDHPCQQQGETRDHAVKWWFLSTHAHLSGENLEVAHVGCNLYVD